MLIIPIILLLVAVLLSLRFIITGPTNVDKLIAGDIFGVAICLLLILVALQLRSTLVLDVVIAYAILLFADVLLLAKFLERGEVHL